MVRSSVPSWRTPDSHATCIPPVLLTFELRSYLGIQRPYFIKLALGFVNGLVAPLVALERELVPGLGRYHRVKLTSIVILVEFLPEPFKCAKYFRAAPDSAEGRGVGDIEAEEMDAYMPFLHGYRQRTDDVNELMRKKGMVQCKKKVNVSNSYGSWGWGRRRARAGSSHERNTRGSRAPFGLATAAGGALVCVLDNNIRGCHSHQGDVAVTP
ncbi:hypothetical protein AG1IA_09928 [Rhizoctonia solani AG-1 IA]|uniref:Uncharacterized protein n=1 Tax=Thanatephorus cucumeris (strain AG1-IA) TaxID=983506 RepID=L8WH34_THACA|nr:hypothetical protein AG1IA_09928 [Rhizoctonia solani AG-1 IA]